MPARNMLPLPVTVRPDRFTCPARNDNSATRGRSLHAHARSGKAYSGVVMAFAMAGIPTLLLLYCDLVRTTFPPPG